MMEGFATCRLEDGRVRRLSRVPRKFRKPGYEGAFDATTLWLDAIWSAGKVTLVCPRLNNLAPLFRDGALRLDGVPVSPQVRTFYRHSLVTMKCAVPPARVSLAVEGVRMEGPVHIANHDRFRNANVIVTMSRDNDLVWIEDFAGFHATAQGAQGIVFIDNASADYGVCDIECALGRAGLDALVLRTDLPFGPRGRKPFANAELYLQTCAFNAVRLRYLQHARAVLCCDIDELVIARSPVSVFDAAWHSRFGYVRFGGEWRYAAPPQDGRLVRHADHDLCDPGKSACPTKWCVRPSGPLGDLQWRPHILEGFLFNRAFRSRRFTYHHCRQITTGWKRDPAAGDLARLRPARTAWELARDTRAGRRASGGQTTGDGTSVRLRRVGEGLSRRFFGLRPALQVACLVAASFMGLAIEEFIDNDPASQEIAYLMDTLLY